MLFQEEKKKREREKVRARENTAYLSLCRKREELLNFGLNSKQLLGQILFISAKMRENKIPSSMYEGLND